MPLKYACPKCKTDITNNMICFKQVNTNFKRLEVIYTNIKGVRYCPKCDSIWYLKSKMKEKGELKKNE